MIWYHYLHQQRFYDRYNVKEISSSSIEQITLEDAWDHLRIIPFDSPPTSEEDDWILTNISVAREWCESWSMCALVPKTLELGIMMFPGSYAGFSVLPQNRPGYFLEDIWRNNGILLPYAAPFQSVESVSYTDTSGQEVVMDPTAYYVNDYERPAAIYPAPMTVWPVAQMQNRRAVRIRYRCGYNVLDNSISPQTVSNLPFQFRAAMLLVLGHLHENRENTSDVMMSEIPLGAASLMERYRVRLSMA